MDNASDYGSEDSKIRTEVKGENIAAGSMVTYVKMVLNRCVYFLC